MRKYILISLFTLFSMGIYAQNISDDKDFKEFCQEYSTFYSSNEYISYKKDTYELIDKLPDKHDVELYLDFDKWIHNNLSLTKFKTVEEAKELREKVTILDKNLKEKDKKLNETLFKFVDKYGYDNFRSVFDEKVMFKLIEVYAANDLQF